MTDPYLNPNDTDYIDRIISTVRQHWGSGNAWESWANELANEVESLRRQLAEERIRYDSLLIGYLDTKHTREP